MSTVRKIALPDNIIIRALKSSAEELGGTAFIVGGTVRDIILGRPIMDIDIVAFGCDYEKLAFAVAKIAKSVAVSFKDNIRLIKGDIIADISKPRGDDIYEDLMMRDFTINNLASTLDGVVVGDDTDIRNKIIRVVADSAFDDDPLRALRTFRFSATLGFDIDEDTMRLASAKAPLLCKIAPERITDELRKMFAGDFLINAIDKAIDSGIMRVIFPLCDFDTAALLRMKAIIPADNPLFLPLLLSVFIDCKKTDLKLSNKEDDLLSKLAAESEDVRSSEDIEQSVWRYYTKIDNIIKYLKAKYPYEIALIDNIDTAIKKIKPEKAALINGALLQSLGFKPSALFKVIINDAAEKAALGKIEEHEIKDYIIKKYKEAIL